MFEETEERTIAIDFDGVIHKSSKGFYDGTIYDDPVPGSLEAIKKIAQQYRVVIFTAKAKKERPLINGKTGKELVWEWLRKYQVAEFIDVVTAEKPRAFLYIDDRGYRFENWDDTFTFLNNIGKIK